jgi:hypothetical protein
MPAESSSFRMKAASRPVSALPSISFETPPSGSSSPLDLRVILTMCLEGGDEDLVFDAMVDERIAAVKELNWPGDRKTPQRVALLALE